MTQTIDSREQIYVIQFTSSEVHFPCRTCGKTLELKKPELGYTSNTFCPGCSRQYWVDWHAGVLHMGLDEKQVYDQMMNWLVKKLAISTRHAS